MSNLTSYPNSPIGLFLANTFEA